MLQNARVVLVSYDPSLRTNDLASVEVSKLVVTSVSQYNILLELKKTIFRKVKASRKDFREQKRCETYKRALIERKSRMYKY